MSAVCVDPTEPGSETEHYKSKHKATSSHEFDMFERHRTHAGLWSDTFSCCATLLKQVSVVRLYRTFLSNCALHEQVSGQ